MAGCHPSIGQSSNSMQWKSFGLIIITIAIFVIVIVNRKDGKKDITIAFRHELNKTWEREKRKQTKQKRNDKNSLNFRLQSIYFRIKENTEIEINIAEVSGPKGVELKKVKSQITRHTNTETDQTLLSTMKPSG